MAEPNGQAPNPNAVPVHDLLDPYLGAAEYVPMQQGEGFDNPLQAVGTMFNNTFQSGRNIYQGLQAMEALGLSRVGRITPTLHQGLEFASRGAQALGNPWILGPLSNPQLQSALEANPASQETLKAPITKEDLPYIQKAALGIVKQPLDDYIRPALQGHPEAPLVNFARDPLTAATNLSAGGSVVKSLPGMARVATKAAKNAPALAGGITKQLQESAQKFQDAVQSMPVNQAQKAMEPITGDLPGNLQQQFRMRRAELQKKWDAIPDDIKPAVGAAMSKTDPQAMQLVSQSPAAQDFMQAATAHEEQVFSEAAGRGMFGKMDYLATRLGPQYMKAVKSGKWPAPFLRRVREVSTDIKAGDLYDDLIQKDMEDFAKQTRTKAGDYVPLVNEEEANAHMQQPVNFSLYAKKAGQASEDVPQDIGAMKRRNESRLSKNSGYLQLTSGKETPNLAAAFITRMEQVDRAIALYDWAQEFVNDFQKLPARTQKLIAQRMGGVLKQACDAAGVPLPENALVDALAGTAGAEGMVEVIEATATHLADYFTGKTPGIAAEVGAVLENKFGPAGKMLSPKKVATVQRLVSILPDMFFPIFMFGQQAIAFVSHAAGGPRVAARSFIAGYLVANKRIAKMIVPNNVLEHSRVFKPKWSARNPMVNRMLTAAAEAVHLMTKYQDMTTRAINYFRSTAAVTHMLTEFDSLPANAQKHVLKGVVQQTRMAKTVRALAQQKRAMEGGFTHRTFHDPKPILKKLQSIGNRRRYRNAQIKKGMKKYNSISNWMQDNAHTATPEELERLTNRQNKILGQVEKWTEEVKTLEGERDALLAGKKRLLAPSRLLEQDPYSQKGPYYKPQYVKTFVEEKQMGLRGFTSVEAQKALDDMARFVNDFYGNYQLRYAGAADDLNTTILWLSMKLHAIRLAKRLHTDFGVTGTSWDHMATFAKEEQRKEAEANNLPSWAVAMGCWDSGRYSPDGTKEVYAPRGWILLTQSMSIPNEIQRLMFPDAVGVETEGEDLNLFAKVPILFSGHRPGTERALRNPGLYMVGENFYKPETLAARIEAGENPDLLEDKVSTSWPSLAHMVYQGLVESASEKWWSQGKSFNRAATVLGDAQNGFLGQEPSDLTIPGNPFAQYPKHVDNDPFGPAQAASPINLTSLFPGGSKLSPFTFRQSVRTDRFEAQQKRMLLKKAIQAAAMLEAQRAGTAGNTSQPSIKHRHVRIKRAGQ